MRTRIKVGALLCSWSCFFALFFLCGPFAPSPPSSQAIARACHPLISIVVVLRNDGYGGERDWGRFQIFFDVLARQSAEHGVAAEVVAVEWNPPEGPGLAQAFDWPANLQVRVITVPPAFHRTLPNADVRTVFEFVAKNVGIRRAHGDWILALNGDDVLTDETWRDIFDEERLSSPDTYYRAVRFDSTRVPPTVATADVSAYLERHEVKAMLVYPPFAGTRFSEADGVRWNEWMNKQQRRIRFLDARLARARATDGPSEELDAVVDEHVLWSMPTDGSGDFMLFSRQSWAELGGFDERQNYKYYHWDTLLLCKAFASRTLKLEVLFPPYAVHHMNHARNADSSAMSGDVRNSDEWMAETCRDLYSRKIAWGRPDWGCPYEDFPETLVGAAVPCPTWRDAWQR